MSDLLKRGMSEAKSSGIKTPAQMKNIAGPGVRMDNSIQSKSQKNLKIGKKG
jgi:hypothetical protein